MVADTNSPLVERVARALCAHDFRKRYGEAAEATAEANWTLFTPIARVAIEAQSDLITRLSSARDAAEKLLAVGQFVREDETESALRELRAALNAVRSDTRQEEGK